MASGVGARIVRHHAARNIINSLSPTSLDFRRADRAGSVLGRHQAALAWDLYIRVDGGPHFPASKMLMKPASAPQ